MRISANLCEGIGGLTPQRLAEIEGASNTVAIVSRAIQTPTGISLTAGPEALDRNDPLARLQGASNLLQIETDWMGTLGIAELHPTVEQTAYGLFSDLVDIARSI